MVAHLLARLVQFCLDLDIDHDIIEVGDRTRLFVLFGSASIEHIVKLDSDSDFCVQTCRLQQRHVKLEEFRAYEHLTLAFNFCADIPFEHAGENIVIIHGSFC